MNDLIKVLDHGFVRLVDIMGDDLSIVRSARVSHNAAWRAGENTGSDDKLIRYLWRNRHSTPFEAVTLTFEVKAPIFVFRQWHRHRTWSYNEVSARYTELPEEFYVPKPGHYGAPSTVNKQARELLTITEGSGVVLEWEKYLHWENEQRVFMESAFCLYRRHLAEGMPRELARVILPLSTYSHMFATVNLLNLFKFMTLRNTPDAQYEIRKYGEALLQLVRPVAPVAVSAWDSSHE
jgi:thymidylate synthase (FAD)